MSKKRQRRVEDVVNSYESAVISGNEESALTSKDDDELFVLDRSGSKNSRRKIMKDENAKLAQKVVSKTERVLIEKLRSKTDKKNKPSLTPKVTDIWGEGNETSAKANPKKKALKIPRAGFSYNPSLHEHQDMVAEAVALTLKHEEDILRSKKALESQMSTIEAAALAAPDGSESDSDNSSGAEEGVVTGRRLRNKRKEKLTRAQRNKIRDRNISANEKGRVKDEKQILKDLDALPRHVQAVDAREKRLEDKKAYVSLLRENAAQGSEGMTYAEAEAVPLSDELSGSLRTIVPKGRAIVDQTDAMRTAGELMTRDRRTRKTREKPHAGKKVKWVARYKY